MTRLPSLFVSHGAPTWALEPGLAGPRLRALGERLPRPRAVLVVSPHWTTAGVRVGTAATPSTIHDFGGFAPALYELEYPAAGHPALAAETLAALAAAGWAPRADAARGLDHGAWVPLRHLYPAADVPAFQVSMPFGLDAAGALRLGRALSPMSARGVLVIGSGSLTHNLRDVFEGADGDTGYVEPFVHWVRDAAAAGDLARLASAMHAAPQAARAHPTDEHFLPLLVAAAAAGAAPGTPFEPIDGGIDHGVLAMDAFVFGGSPAPHGGRASSGTGRPARDAVPG